MVRGDDFREVMTLELGSGRMNKCPRGRGGIPGNGNIIRKA